MADSCEGSQGPTSLQCCGQSECISPRNIGKSVNVSTISFMVARFSCNTPGISGAWMDRRIRAADFRFSQFYNSSYLRVCVLDLFGNNLHQLCFKPFSRLDVIPFEQCFYTPIYFTPSQMIFSELFAPHSTVYLPQLGTANLSITPTSPLSKQRYFYSSFSIE